MEPGDYNSPLGERRVHDPRGILKQLDSRVSLDISRVPGVRQALYDGDETLFIWIEGKKKPMHIYIESTEFKDKMLKDRNFSDRVISNLLVTYQTFDKNKRSDPERKEDYFTINDSKFSVYHESGIGDFFRAMFGLVQPEEVVDLAEQPHSQKIGIPVDLRKGLGGVRIPTELEEIDDILSSVVTYLERHPKDCLLPAEARYLQALLDKIPPEHKSGPLFQDMESYIADTVTGPGHVIPIPQRPGGSAT